MGGARTFGQARVACGRLATRYKPPMSWRSLRLSRRHLTMGMTPGTVGQLERLTSFINNSATIVENAGANIASPAHKAVAYDASGNVVLATNGEEAIGVILSSSHDPISQGGQVNILVKNIGLLEAGGAISKGACVTINGNGQGVTAQTGDFIFVDFTAKRYARFSPESASRAVLRVLEAAAV